MGKKKGRPATGRARDTWIRARATRAEKKKLELLVRHIARARGGKFTLSDYVREKVFGRARRRQ